MKPQVLLLIVLGLILGPAYYAYCEYLSGETAEIYTLGERANRWELPDGAILRFRSGMGYKPLPIELDPESNHYRFRFTFRMAASESASVDAVNHYQVSLLQGDLGVFERTFQVRGSGAVSVALDPMRIPYRDNYVLLIEEIGAPPLAVAGVTLEVRRKVEELQAWLAWSGVVLMVLGAAIAVRDVVIQLPKR